MGFSVDTIQDEFEVADDYQMATRIMVFGVGGAGGNAVRHMVEFGVSDVDYVIANTDVAALRSQDGSKMKRIQIGRKTTRGRGAGNNPAKGQESAEENRDDIAAVLDGVSMLFVAAGMGGGTGTGAAPVVASIAKEKGILTVGVVTKPFDWEGTHKMAQAMSGISEMKKYVDALIVIPNDRVRQLKGNNITAKNAFEKVDEVLCKAVMGIIKLIQNTGYLNVDFSDITMALKDSGIAHMAMGSGKGDNKTAQALDEVLNSPLLETSISGARRGLVCISIPENSSFEEFENTAKEISEKFTYGAQYKCGINLDPDLADDEISIIAIATDFDSEAGDPEELESLSSVDSSVSSVSSDNGGAGVSVTKTSSGLTGNVGFPTSDDGIDTLLKKFSQMNNGN